jgi:Cytotoxic translational repressor of toxin-antitoxin stability system
VAEYQITISRSATKEFEALPGSVIERVRRKIRSLIIDPRPAGCKKLEGKNRWRIRVGDWRILYEIDDRQRLVDVGAIRHRSNAYD